MKDGIPGAMLNSSDSNEKEVELFVLTNMCGSRGGRGGAGGPDPPLLENYKSIVFISNTGWDTLNNHKATKPAFHVWPPSARQ